MLHEHLQDAIRGLVDRVEKEILLGDVAEVVEKSEASYINYLYAELQEAQKRFAGCGCFQCQKIYEKLSRFVAAEEARLAPQQILEGGHLDHEELFVHGWVFGLMTAYFEALVELDECSIDELDEVMERERDLFRDFMRAVKIANQVSNFDYQDLYHRTHEEITRKISSRSRR